MMAQRACFLVCFLLVTLPAAVRAAGEKAAARGAAKPDESVAAIDRFIAYQKPLLGPWKATVEEDGKTYHGTVIWQLADNQKCFSINL